PDARRRATRGAALPHPLRPYRSRDRRTRAGAGLPKEAGPRAHGLDTSGERALQTAARHRHRVLLVLHDGRGFPLAERVLPSASSARRPRGLGPLLGELRAIRTVIVPRRLRAPAP